MPFIDEEQWEDASFRQGFKELLQLPPATVRELVVLLREAGPQSQDLAARTMELFATLPEELASRDRV